MNIMREEKGYIIVGKDKDGKVKKEDERIGWEIGKKKKDLVGKR